MSTKSIMIILGVILILIGIVLIYFGFAPIPSLVLVIGYILVGIALIPENNSNGKEEKK